MIKTFGGCAPVRKEDAMFCLLISYKNFGKFVKGTQKEICQVLILTTNLPVLTRKKLLCGKLKIFIGKMTKVYYQY